MTVGITTAIERGLRGEDHERQLRPIVSLGGTLGWRFSPRL
jgi:hypothetical protein